MNHLVKYIEEKSLVRIQVTTNFQYLTMAIFVRIRQKKSIEYLKQYEARNPDILNIKKSTHPSSKPSLREDFLALEKYERKKKKIPKSI